jgi:hypothetical protein
MTILGLMNVYIMVRISKTALQLAEGSAPTPETGIVRPAILYHEMVWKCLSGQGQYSVSGLALASMGMSATAGNAGSAGGTMARRG